MQRPTIGNTLRKLVPDLDRRAAVELTRSHRLTKAAARCNAQLLTKHPYDTVQRFRLACNAQRRSQSGVIREAMLRFIAETDER